MIDVRANSTTPFAVSDDQEDELLSIVSIKGYRLSRLSYSNDADPASRGSKHVVGTQLGVLSVFERAKGWQDSVDRIMGYVRLTSDPSH